ncbi:MAG: lipocalin family protein [Vicinamibacterales bacterium]
MGLHAIAALAAVAVAGTALTAQGQDRPVSTVPRVDLERYAGTWYEIARFPNRFQDQCAGDVTATYAPRPDGRLDVINRCRTTAGETDEARGVARVVKGSQNAKLEVRFAPGFLSFLPFVWGDYWVLGLDEEYRWAVVGSPDRDYLWVLARTPSVDEAIFDGAVDVARREGFDVSRLERTPQGLP